MDYELISSTINNAISNPKLDLVTQIEQDFNAYLKENNPEFYTCPRPYTLIYLFNLYDKYYFSGALAKHIAVIIKYSLKLTRSAGMVRYYPKAKAKPTFDLDVVFARMTANQTKGKIKPEAHITFSIPLIFGAYHKETKGYIVNGILCKNPAEALMRVMEHELTHLIEFILYNKSSCKKPQFQKICYTLFGHTESKHRIGVMTSENRPLTSNPKRQTSESIRQISDLRFRKGDRVSFIYKDTKYSGTIKRITKRATVMTEQNRKFYVPLTLLEKI